MSNATHVMCAHYAINDGSTDHRLMPLVNAVGIANKCSREAHDGFKWHVRGSQSNSINTSLHEFRIMLSRKSPRCMHLQLITQVTFGLKTRPFAFICWLAHRLVYNYFIHFSLPQVNIDTTTKINSDTHSPTINSTLPTLIMNKPRRWCVPTPCVVSRLRVCFSDFNFGCCRQLRGGALRDFECRCL